MSVVLSPVSESPCPKGAERAEKGGIARRVFGGVLACVCSVFGFGCAPGASEGGGDRVELEFRLALQPDPENKAWEGANLVREFLERESNGRIRVVFYDSGVLGDEQALLMNCYLGIVEVVQTTSSVVTTLDATLALLDLPYLFVSAEHHRDVLYGPIGQDMLDGLRAHRLQGLGFFSCGFRNLFNTRGLAVSTPDDLRGLKVRVMESPVMIQSINAMGGSATPLPAGELFQALRTGVVDAAENNANVYVSARFDEAGARNFSLTEHFANQHMMVANLAWLERVRRDHPDLHALILEAPRRVREEYDRRWDAAVASAFIAMEAQGVAVNTVGDKQPFVERVRSLHDEFLRRYPEVDATLLERIRQEAAMP